MITNNFAIYSNKIIFGLIFDVLYFPFWWYGVGFSNIIVLLGSFLSQRQQSLAFFVWIKNIGKPMYGQTDFAGATISFFIRLIQIVFRGSIMIFWLGVVIILLSAWLLLPILVIAELYFQVN